MRQKGQTAIREEATKGRRGSATDAQARIDALEAELAEAREQQAATSELLQVINASPGDLAPVFEALLEKAMHLCAAVFGYLMTYDGERFDVVAQRGLPPRFAGYLQRMDQPGQSGAYARIKAGAPYVGIADLKDGDVYRTSPLRRALVDLGGARSGVIVALRKDNTLLGVLTFYRQKVRPFSDKQIALLQNFAEQAVIAMDNARLLGELRRRTHELARREAELRGSEERYALISTAVAEGIYEWEVEPNSLWVSSRLMEIFGFEGRDLTAGDWNALVHPDDFPSYRAAVRDCLKGLTLRLDCEYRVRHSDGRYRWIEDRGSVVRNEGGRAIRLAGAVSDVTERKATEQALHHSEQRYDLALRAIKEGVYEWDLATDEMYYSPRVRELVVLEPDDHTLADWMQRVHPDDAAQLRSATIAHFKGETDRIECEYRYRHADGRWHWARHHGIALRDENGRAHRVVGSVGDITSERELAQELERARGQLHVAIEALDEGFALFDPEDRLIICNSRYARFFHDHAAVTLVPGMTFEEFIRAGLARGMFPHAGDDPEAWLAALLARRHQSGTREQHLAGGVWLRVSDYLTKDGSRVSVYSDITDMKRRQQELEEAKEAAESALERLSAAQQQLVLQQKMAALGQLTAGIAHEIKNPLNFVNNFAGLSVELLDELKEVAAPALAGLGDEERVELDDTIAMLTSNLDKIAEHGKRADGIVRSMLAHSRGAGGERQAVDINGLVDEALNLAYHGARAHDQNFNVTLKREFDDAAAPVELVRQDITRVFLNLFGNGFYAAAKRSREADGRAVLTVATRDLGEAVEVTVRDNGGGISPENRDKLFQPFFTTKPPGEGTGLGLSISYEIVTQQHGGTIEVDSEVGAFTEFRVRLPRKRQVAMAERGGRA